MTIAAGVVFLAAGQVLLMLRSGGDHAGTWGFPGGKLEEGETPETAAMREAQEETGYVLGLVGPRVGEYDGFMAFRVELGEPFTPVLNDEHSAFVWADPAALPEPLHPGVADLVAAALAPPTTARRYDGNGWFEIEDNPISKEGVFPYSGAQLGMTDPAQAEQIFMVYRSAEELSAPACLESFRLLPWIDEHVMLGPEAQRFCASAVAAEEKGVAGVIGEKVYFRDGYLRGNIKVFSSTLAQLIAAGKRELSAGYKCRYDAEAGEWNGQPYQFVQRDIRGNHLALVDAGRMGPDVAVMDKFVFSCDAKEAATMKQKLKLAAARALVLAALGSVAAPPAAGGAALALDKAPEHARLFAAMDEAAAEKKEGADAGELTVEQLSEIIKTYAPQLRELMGALGGEAPEAKVEGVEDEEDPEEKQAADEDDPTESESAAAGPASAASGEDAKLRAEVKHLRSAMDGAEALFLKRAAQRDQLARRLAPVIGVFDHASMTLEGVAKYAVGKLGLTAPAGTELVALDAYLAAKPADSGVVVRIGSAMDAAATAGGPLSSHFTKEA